MSELQAAQSMSKKNGATLDSKGKDNEEKLSHPSHRHKLTLLQLEPTNGGSSEEKIKYCDGCNEVMCFPGYACEFHECSFFSFYLHKSCAELPPKILHPLHPHPLTSSLIIRDGRDPIICDGCRDLYRSGFIFNCSWCGFNLDAKCASKQDQEHHQTFKELTLFRFYHKHALKLCNIPSIRSGYPFCSCCMQFISTGSSAYCCLQCKFYIHESCKEIPKEVEHPFHPQHILVTQIMDDCRKCAACLLSIGLDSEIYDLDSENDHSIASIGISCKECDFNLHVLCANPNRWASPIKHNCHQHNMFYFIVKDRYWCSFKCNKCQEKFFDDEAIYRCVECDFNLHFKCIPIPSVVMITQKHHHPLTLIDSIKEDNPLIQYLMDSNDKVDYSMDYYCDVCETPGNPRHHAYCCKECIYIAHVECIISEEGVASKEMRKGTIHQFFHQHQLKLRFFFNTTRFSRWCYCCWCNEKIKGPGYCCIDCKFFIHDFCCMEIPRRLQNPLHPHPLHPKNFFPLRPKNNFNLDGTTWMCRACRQPPKLFDCATLTLSCEECNFDLHSDCATWTMKLYLKHECHNHNLYFPFDLKDNVLYCNKCHDTGGYFYCCRECDINFHFECIPLPCDVKHKSHTHPLTLTYPPKIEDYYRDLVSCAICKARYLIDGHPIFICAECKYIRTFVHIECAISEDDTAVEVLKYLNPRPEKEQRSSTEDHCGRPELDRGNGNGNGSEKMETLALELEALEEKHANKKDTPPKIPSNLNPRHGTEPKKEQKMSDESDRNTEQAAQSMSKKNGASTSLDSKCVDNEELFSHPSLPDHKLTLLQHEESKEDESDDETSEEKIKNCIFCLEVMSFPGYACESAKHKFYLHKSCAELPPNILHPLHPHPLTCSLRDDFEDDEVLICDGCRDLYVSRFNFSCSWCGFNLDAKCASKQDLEYHQTFKELTLFRFYHKHALKLCNVPKLIFARILCCCCMQIISTGSSAYCCIDCLFFIHESCKEIPMEIHHPFHSQHILVAQTEVWDTYSGRYESCAACKRSIHGIKIGCNECYFELHVSCANPNRWASPLKHNCHEHNIYYFVKDDTTESSVDDSDTEGSFECNKCRERCVNESFYRCVECDFNLHLKCIPIPSVVMNTQKHRHPLTLMDSVKEDNPFIQYLMDSNDKVDYSMDYYCDICETPGNPRNHTYCCKECIYIAHVECIISKDNTSPEFLSNLNPTHGAEPKKEQNNTSDDE